MKLHRLNLQTRLMLACLVVASFALLTVFVVGLNLAPVYFREHLTALQAQNPDPTFLREEAAELRTGFDYAWRIGTLWGLGLSLPLAAGLSFWVSRRISQPLVEVQEGIAQFAKGNFTHRLASTGIPEIDRLVLNFNTMADSLEEVEEHRQRLIADLAHELRTPLTVLAGYLEQLQDGVLTPDPIIYSRLWRETQRLRKLVSALQELSRAEAGYLALDLQSVDLKTLCQEVVAKFAIQIPEDGPDLHLDIPALPLVWADPERLEQILLNLLSNALRHTATGQIRLHAHRRDDEVELAVQDTGTGIAPGDLPFLFERFWRSDQARTRETGGNGIGLTIVKKLVEIQGGQIQVESQPGQGACFRFTIPIAS